MDVFVDYSQYAYYNDSHWVTTGYSIKTIVILSLVTLLASAFVGIATYDFESGGCNTIFDVIGAILITVLSTLAIGINLTIYAAAERVDLSDSYEIESLTSLIEQEYGFKDVEKMNDAAFTLDSNGNLSDRTFSFNYLNDAGTIKTARVIWNGDAFIGEDKHPQISIFDENNNAIKPSKKLDYSTCDELMNGKYIDKIQSTTKKDVVEVCHANEE